MPGAGAAVRVQCAHAGRGSSADCVVLVCARLTRLLLSLRCCCCCCRWPSSSDAAGGLAVVMAGCAAGGAGCVHAGPCAQLEQMTTALHARVSSEREVRGDADAQVLARVMAALLVARDNQAVCRDVACVGCPFAMRVLSLLTQTAVRVPHDGMQRASSVSAEGQSQQPAWQCGKPVSL